jgi:hypothetical protein
MDTKTEDRAAECPVAALIHEAQSLIDAYDAADGAHTKSVWAPKTDETRKVAFRHDAQIEQTFNFLEGVKARATYLKATSARGALFQICLINGLTCDLETYGAGNDNRDADAAEHAINRMLYSLAEFIERETGEKMENACSDYFMGRNINPHEIVAEAMALCQPAKEGARI